MSVNMVAERIRQRRTELGLSQIDLAYRMHTNPTQVSRYERGENDPSGTVLVALARELKTSTDWLLGLTNDMPTNSSLDNLDPDEREAIAAWRRGDHKEAIRIISSS